ncbi:uncharacterized protein LOC111052031 [Nilaparvata lugens]|uniref:uncharacterized protein LOC111052031 n=1 Tax=Nilaparvata lugens TaxID=108931 RepID=UPI00193D4519|nr:uncharacterized protein LOC111052031 [Nilaparvata lugens]
MEVASFLGKYNDLMCYKNKEPYNSLPVIFYAVIFVYIEYDMFVALAIEPKTLENTVLTVLDAVMISILFCYSVIRNINNADVRNLMDLVEGEFPFNRRDMVLANRLALLEEIEQFYESKRKYMRSMANNLACIFFVYGFLVNNRNVFNYLTGIINNDDSNVWPTPYVSHCPSLLRSPVFFLYTYFLHTILMSIFMMEALFVIMLVFLSTETIISDFGTLHILLGHLTNNYPDLIKQNCIAQSSSLRKDMSRIIQFHQTMIKNFEVCIKGSGLMISVVNLVIMLYCCSIAYLMLTTTDLKKRLNFAMSFLLVTLTIFSIYQNGQRIYNQNDILRQNLAELPWTDKPQWFKQCLLMMMTRANIDMKMSPYRIYNLNYVSFKDWVKFVFSTGNILYTKKLSSQA